MPCSSASTLLTQSTIPLPAIPGLTGAQQQALRLWGQQILTQIQAASSQLAVNVIPSQFQTFTTQASSAVLAALTATNCTPAVDSTTQYYGAASLKVAIASSGATLTFTGYPITIAPGKNWFGALQILAPSGCTGSLSVLTRGGQTVTESFTAPSSASWQQVWGLFDLRAYADSAATWKLTFTSTATVWLDGMQMNALSDPIAFLPGFNGSQMVAGSIAYASNPLVVQGTCYTSGNDVYKATSGTPATWDSDAYSSQGYLNGAFVSWRAAQANKELMVGFSTNPSASVSYTSLNFGLYQTSGGAIQIYESGNLVYNSGTYATGDSFEVRYDGVTVRYFHNGALLRAIRAPGLLLYPKTCIADAGGVVSGLEFGPASAVNQPTGSWLNTYPWVIGTSGSQGNYGDIAGTGNAASQVILDVGPYGTTEPVWESTSGINGANGGWNNNGDLYGIDSTKTYRSIVWVKWNGVGTAAQFYHGADTNGYTCTVGTQTPDANPYFGPSDGGVGPPANFAPNKWYLAVGILHGSGYTGSDTGVAGVYDPATGQRIIAGTEFNLLAGAPFQTQRVYQYYDTAIGSHLYFAKPRFEEVNGNEPSLQALMQPASAYQGWVETGNAVQTGQAFSKQGGASAWDSTAYTVNAYSTCHIGGKPIVTSGQAMLGLADQPAASNLSGGAAYAPPGHSYMWYTGAGTWEIYEGTTLVGTYGSVAATDLVEITYDGATVTYYLNKVSQRTVAVAGLSLHGWFAPYNPGAGFNSVEFGPTTNLAVVDTGQLNVNAATEVVTSSVAGPVNIYNTGTTATLVGSVSVLALPYATSVVITVIGSVDHNFPSNQTSSCLDVSTTTLSTISTSQSTWIARNASTTAPQTGGSFAKEFTFSLPANTAQTYYVYGLATVGGAVAGAYSNLYNVQIKAEVIKR